MGSRVRIRLFHILHFVMDFLFPLLKNSKSGVDDRGHRLRSGSLVTNLPGASPPTIVLLDRRFFFNPTFRGTSCFSVTVAPAFSWKAVW